MPKRLSILVLVVLCSGLLGCGGDDPVTPPGSSRTYAMGFTPFPYAFTSEAVTYVYSKIASEADLIAHHLDDGVPWIDALNDSPFHTAIMDEWNERKNNTPAQHKVFLAVTPISPFRDNLALLKDAQGNQPLPPPWDTYPFNHADVKTAYLNYCTRAIDFFAPDYVAIGIEVNLLMEFNPASWPDYMELHEHVYTQLKILYPNLVIMVSLTGADLVDGYTGVDHAGQVQALADILPFTDRYGLSLHTFMAFPDGISPPDMLDQIFDLSTKPICICETSHPAESFSIYGGTINFTGSEAAQADFFAGLFQQATDREMEFIVNFVVRDYDDLWRAIGSPDDINKVWRDTGFYDESGNPRLVRQLWLDELAK